MCWSTGGPSWGNGCGIGQRMGLRLVWVFGFRVDAVEVDDWIVWIPDRAVIRLKIFVLGSRVNKRFVLCDNNLQLDSRAWRFDSLAGAYYGGR